MLISQSHKDGSSQQGASHNHDQQLEFNKSSAFFCVCFCNWFFLVLWETDLLLKCRVFFKGHLNKNQARSLDDGTESVEKGCR